MDGRGSLRGERYKRHVIRRLKEHVRDTRTGESLFRERQVHPTRLPLDPEELPRYAAFQRALLALIAPRLRRAFRARRFEEVLAFLTLLKRSSSTVAACRNTLRVVAERYRLLLEAGREEQQGRKERLRSLRDYQHRMERFGVLSFEEEADRAELEAADIASDLLAEGAEELTEHLAEARRELRRESRRLKRDQETDAVLLELLGLANEAPEEDPKLDGCLAALRDIRAAEPGANVLVYTEFSDSQDALVERLEAALEARELDGTVLRIRGRDDEEARRAVTDRFTSEDGLILVSTDSSAEGLNLHARCHHLVHLELPYNPNRLEQRNGRIDRFGQTHDPPRSATCTWPGPSRSAC